MSKKDKKASEDALTIGADKESDFTGAQSEPQQMARMPVTIHGQYIKDLSFENPKAPHSLRYTEGKPLMDLNFSMDARKLAIEDRENMYEVTLGVQAQAKRGDKTSFILEVEYGVVCSVHDVPEDAVHPLLLIEMPRVAFPFVRQIVANITQQAGFMPLLLEPVDFRAFYMQRYGQPEGAPKEKAAG